MNRWYKVRLMGWAACYGGRISPYALCYNALCAYLILSCFFLHDGGITLMKFLNEYWVMFRFGLVVKFLLITPCTATFDFPK